MVYIVLGPGTHFGVGLGREGEHIALAGGELQGIGLPPGHHISHSLLILRKTQIHTGELPHFLSDVLLMVVVGVSAEDTALPVDLISGGVDADVGLFRSQIGVVLVVIFYAGIAHEVRADGVIIVVLTLAADVAGVIPAQGLGAVGIMCHPVGRLDDGAVGMAGAVVLCGGHTGLLCGIHVTVVDLDGEAGGIRAKGVLHGSRRGAGDAQCGVGGAKGGAVGPVPMGEALGALLQALHELDNVHLVAEPDLLQIGEIDHISGEGLLLVIIGKERGLKVNDELGDVVPVILGVVIEENVVPCIAVFGLCAPVQNDHVIGPLFHPQCVGLGSGVWSGRGPQNCVAQVKFIHRACIRRARIRQACKGIGQDHLTFGEFLIDSFLTVDRQGARVGINKGLIHAVLHSEGHFNLVGFSGLKAAVVIKIAYPPGVRHLAACRGFHRGNSGFFAHRRLSHSHPDGADVIRRQSCRGQQGQQHGGKQKNAQNFLLHMVFSSIFSSTAFSMVFNKNCSVSDSSCVVGQRRYPSHEGHV